MRRSTQCLRQIDPLSRPKHRALPGLEVSPKVGDGKNRKGGISWGVESLHFSTEGAICRVQRKRVRTGSARSL
jgi:hypothetical protein